MAKRICPVCGRMETDDAVYCRECGAKTVEQQDSSGQYGGQGAQYSNYQDYTSNIPYQQPMDDGVGNSTNGLQIAGLVCGILAICSCCCYGIPAVILGIAGVICAVQGNKNGKSSVGTAGFVCSIIGLVLGVMSTIYYVWVVNYLTQVGYWDMLDMF